MSVREHVEQPQAMLDAGAVAYVSKNEPPSALLNAIRRCGMAQERTSICSIRARQAQHACRPLA